MVHLGSGPPVAPPFRKHPAGARKYLAAHRGTEPPSVLAVANTAAGSGKTTAALHLALGALFDGARVLAINLDGQGHLTRALARPDSPSNPEGILPALARHYAEHLQAENRARIVLGQPPLPLDETLARALALRLPDLIRPSRWAGIDLLGSGPDLVAADPEMATWMLTAPGWRPFAALQDRLRLEGLTGPEAPYDLIVIDTGPSLGQLTQCALAAADIVLVPTLTDAEATAATAAFLRLYARAFARIEAAQNRTARALGAEQMRFDWAALRLCVSRHDPAMGPDAAQAMADLAARMGRALLPGPLAESPLITATRAIHDTDPRNCSRDSLIRARDQAAAFWSGIRPLLRNRPRN